MSDTKFTPGPWYMTKSGRLLRVGKSRKCSGVVLAGIHKFGNLGGAVVEGTPEANAHLIAAAPEMYAALEWAARNADESEAGRDDAWYAGLENCLAVLAKARGETP